MLVEKRDVPPTGILQEWVARLGLRHQGVLLTVVRGCDTAPKQDASKDLTRALRGEILNTHCANPADAKSFIEVCSLGTLGARFSAFRKSCDHYPHHFVMHVIHAIEVIGYCHPDSNRRAAYFSFYVRLCRGLHVRVETETEMNDRLNADEATFASSQ